MKITILKSETWDIVKLLKDRRVENAKWVH